MIKGKRRTTWGFSEELAPGERKDFNFVTPSYDRKRNEIPKGTVIQRVASHPWFVVIWEPLTSKVPGPHMARVWCCYARTVIFYLRPWMPREFNHIYNIGGKWGVTKPGQHLEEWARSEHFFVSDDVVEFEGEQFKIGAGRVMYHNKRWWMRYSGRREKV